MLMNCGYGAVNVQVIETSINKLSMENQFLKNSVEEKNDFNTDFIAVN